MLSVIVSLSPEGCLERLDATGHAGSTPRGANVACAAATALLRTAAELMHSRPGVRCDADAPAPGELRLAVSLIPRESVEWARGVTDFVIQGCRRIQAEVPAALAVQIVKRG